MVKINDHNTPNPKPSSEWSEVPVGSNTEGEIIWDTLSSFGVWPSPSDNSVFVDKQKALEHCRQYPEQWEVLEPRPENASETLRTVYLSLNTRYAEGSAPVKSIMLVLDEADLRSGDAEEMAETHKIISHLARVGRSRGVHVLLSASTPVAA